MDHAPAVTQSPLAQPGNRFRNRLDRLRLQITLMGWPLILYYSTTLPYIYLRIAVLTIIAYISSRTFVTRSPDCPVMFIGNPTNPRLRAFALNADELRLLSAHSPRGIQIFPARHWRAARQVAELLGHSGPTFLHTFDNLIRLDLTNYPLDGPRLTQGQGLIGHGICVTLVEEYGRIPGEKGVLVGQFFCWNRKRLLPGKIPIKHLDIIGVSEDIEIRDGIFRIVWEEMQVAAERGLHAAIFKSGTPEVLYESYSDLEGEDDSKDDGDGDKEDTSVRTLCVEDDPHSTSPP